MPDPHDGRTIELVSLLHQGRFPLRDLSDADMDEINALIGGALMMVRLTGRIDFDASFVRVFEADGFEQAWFQDPDSGASRACSTDSIVFLKIKDLNRACCDNCHLWDSCLALELQPDGTARHIRRCFSFGERSA